MSNIEYYVGKLPVPRSKHHEGVLNPGEIFYYMEKNREAIAYISVSDYEHFHNIVDFSVDKNHQNQGLGTKLMTIALENIKADIILAKPMSDAARHIIVHKIKDNRICLDDKQLTTRLHKEGAS